MKNVLCAIAVAAILSVVSQASAGEPGNVSKKGLSAMGIPSLKVMSDSEGTKVRGTAASVFGASGAYAFRPGAAAGSINAYSASGNFFSAGGSFSAATATGPFGGTSSAAAGGGAIAVGF